jgi:hypothetical protein
MRHIESDGHQFVPAHPHPGAAFNAVGQNAKAGYGFDADLLHRPDKVPHPQTQRIQMAYEVGHQLTRSMVGDPPPAIRFHHLYPISGDGLGRRQKILSALPSTNGEHRGVLDKKEAIANVAGYP